jgi:DNA-binding NarL/FixJ family response regulator
MKIVLCDDHSVFADAVAALLRRRGHEVVSVTQRPGEAVGVLQGEAVEICLLDCAFPDADGHVENGIDYVPALRQAAPQCRIILLSAQLDADTVAAGVAAGVAGFARKQQPLGELLQAIERVAAGELALPDDLLVAALSLRRAPSRAGWPADSYRFFTQREREVLQGIVRGQGTVAMARSLGVSTATARGHVQSVLTKLGVHTRLQAAVLAVREGVISAETGQWMLTD